MAVRAANGSGQAARIGAPRASADDGGVVWLRVAKSAAIDLARVPDAFGDEAPNWLGQPVGRDERGLMGYLCDLELRVSPERFGTFHKAAVVSIGPPVRTPDGWVMAIEWRAATLAPLFPVLVGRLLVAADHIAIDGHYAPPFGLVGYVLDRGLLSIAAQRTANWFLVKVAGVLIS
jgi:hypothetical protein